VTSTSAIDQQPAAVTKPANPLNDGEARRAFLFGVLHDGFKIWSRTSVQYKDIDALDESPELKAALKKYHDTWYTIGVDAPEFAALIILFGYYTMTGGLGTAFKSILSILGVPV